MCIRNRFMALPCVCTIRWTIIRFKFEKDVILNLVILIFCHKILYTVRHLKFLFSNSAYFVNGNTLLMSDLTDN